MLLLLSGVNTLARAAHDIYSLGVVPQFSAKRIHDIWQPVIESLYERTGIKLELHGVSDISEFGRALSRGDFDFAYMNPYHMLVASQQQGYKPLVRDIEKALQGVLVVRTDSGIENVEQLNNEVIAFPSPNALGASLLMRQELNDRFDINIKPTYVSTHDSVYLNVALKQASAGGGVSKTLIKQSDRIRNRLKILYRTDKVASHPIAVHPRVAADVADKIKRAFLSMSQDDMGRRILATIPITVPGGTTLTEYEVLVDRKLKRFTEREN